MVEEICLYTIFKHFDLHINNIWKLLIKGINVEFVIQNKTQNLSADEIHRVHLRVIDLMCRSGKEISRSLQAHFYSVHGKGNECPLRTNYGGN